MALTELQKKAGRVFVAACQAELDALNAAAPPGGRADPRHRVDRHPCPVRGDSFGVVLRETYWTSPLYWACYCGVIEPFAAYAFPHRDCDGGREAAPEGLLGWIWKQGRCSDCGLVLRSSAGRLVLAADRPPERGALCLTDLRRL
jgi:hypothetical protein